MDSMTVNTVYFITFYRAYRVYIFIRAGAPAVRDTFFVILLYLLSYCPVHVRGVKELNCKGTTFSVEIQIFHPLFSVCTDRITVITAIYFNKTHFHGDSLIR